MTTPTPTPPDLDGVEAGLTEADFKRLMLGFAEAADFTQEQDRRVWQWLLDEMKRIMMPATTATEQTHEWLATEDGSEGKGTGRHIACFILEPEALSPSNTGEKVG